MNGFIDILMDVLWSIYLYIYRTPSTKSKQQQQSNNNTKSTDNSSKQGKVLEKCVWVCDIKRIHF